MMYTMRLTPTDCCIVIVRAHCVWGDGVQNQHWIHDLGDRTVAATKRGRRPSRMLSKRLEGSQSGPPLQRIWPVGAEQQSACWVQVHPASGEGAEAPVRGSRRVAAAQSPTHNV